MELKQKFPLSLSRYNHLWPYRSFEATAHHPERHYMNPGQSGEKTKLVQAWKWMEPSTDGRVNKRCVTGRPLGLSARTNIKLRRVAESQRLGSTRWTKLGGLITPNPLPLISGHQATLVQVPPVRETSFRSKLALNFLLTDGASIGAGRWSGTIPICCRSQHSHDTAFRVGSCTL
jgi:hypothetical protein